MTARRRFVLGLVVVVAACSSNRPVNMDSVVAGTDSGACPPHTTLCDGVCVNTNNDPANCGGCGCACQVGAPMCQGGTCIVPCTSGQAPCCVQEAPVTPGCPPACHNAVCVDPQSDDNNCGACGNVCDASKGHDCVSGSCECTAGLTDCGGKCVNTAIDPENCGTCGCQCGNGLPCNQGHCCGCGTGLSPCDPCGDCTCVSLQSDNNNCGACGNTCTGGKACQNGTCVCPSNLTDCNGTCVDLQTDKNNCGACGNVCFGELYCVDGTCA